MRSLHIGLGASLLLLAACAPSKGPEQPNTTSSGPSDTAHVAGGLGDAQHADDQQLLAALREPDAEHNVLAELSCDPTLPECQPKEEIFADAPHIKRASMHLTLLQRSRTRLSDVIAKALAQQPGDVYSVVPDVVDRKPKFHVAIATGGGKSALVDIEGS